MRSLFVGAVALPCADPFGGIPVRAWGCDCRVRATVQCGITFIALHCMGDATCDEIGGFCNAFPKLRLYGPHELSAEWLQRARHTHIGWICVGAARRTRHACTHARPTAPSAAQSTTDRREMSSRSVDCAPRVSAPPRLVSVGTTSSLGVAFGVARSATRPSFRCARWRRRPHTF